VDVRDLVASCLAGIIERPQFAKQNHTFGAQRKEAGSSRDEEGQCISLTPYCSSGIDGLQLEGGRGHRTRFHHIP
jgi:hypothetical protein